MSIGAILDDRETRFDTREDSILDLVLTNDSKIVSSVSPRPPVGHSDHTAIDFRLDVRLVRDPDKNNDNAKNIGNEKDRYIYITGTGLILMDYNRVCPRSTGIIFFVLILMYLMCGLHF